MNTFEQLGLSRQALASLAEVGFTTPTEIQSKTIGIVAGRKDLIASAQTGSGKTVAYALPILDLLRSEERKTKATTKVLVVVPTRELALQVRDEFERFGGKSGFKAVALYGGTGYRKQVQGIHRGADIIVATPGRLLDCLNRNYATLAAVQVVVLDEADRLLDMGFMPQVRAVIARAPKNRQTLMFSATIDSRMKKIAEEFLREPEVVAANQERVEPSSIEQQFHYIKESQKEGKLLDLLLTVDGGSVLVFTRTRRKAGLLTSRLKALDILAEEIHGDISQSQRVRTLTRFKSGEFNVLVATDVAARGLDVPAISHVINFDLPMLAEDYVHRIGRTGRAGRSGIAHSFVSADQRRLVQEIHQVLKKVAGKDDGGDERPMVPAQRLRSRQASEYAERLLAGGRRPSGGRPQEGRPQDGRPQYGRSQDGKPRYGRSEDGRPQYGRSQDGKPQDGRSQDGRPQYGRSQDGKPRYGRSEDGRPQYGRSQDGKPQYGRSQDGPREGRPQQVDLDLDLEAGWKPALPGGKPQHGRPQYGRPQHGKPQGKPQHGRPQEGNGRSRFAKASSGGRKTGGFRSKSR